MLLSLQTLAYRRRERLTSQKQPLQLASWNASEASWISQGSQGFLKLVDPFTSCTCSRSSGTNYQEATWFCKHQNCINAASVHITSLRYISETVFLNTTFCFSESSLRTVATIVVPELHVFIWSIQMVTNAYSPYIRNETCNWLICRIYCESCINIGLFYFIEEMYLGFDPSWYLKLSLGQVVPRSYSIML